MLKERKLNIAPAIKKQVRPHQQLFKKYEKDKEKKYEKDKEKKNEKDNQKKCEKDVICHKYKKKR